MTAERLLRCTEPECPVQVVLMLPSARAWHRHHGGLLHEMAEVFPATSDQERDKVNARRGKGGG